MANSPPPGESGNVPAPVPAQTSAPAFGGNPTGRKTKFRFPAGTPEGDEERRKADADRKAAARAVADKLLEPPPLPSAAQSVADQAATEGGGEVFGAPLALVEVPVPWTADDVREFTDELVDLSETKRVSDFVAVAREAKFPESLVREIEKDAKYPLKSKTGFKSAVAGSAAKWLNKSGISAKNKEEAALIFFGAGIWLQGRRLRAKLDEMVVQEKERLEAEKKKTEVKP